MTTSTLHIGLADFAEPTLLLLFEVASLTWLAERIEARQLVDFEKVPFVTLHDVRLTLQPTEDVGSLAREDQTFIWRITQAESERVAAQLRVLSASKVPAHAYLDPEGNRAGMEVVASKGEYTAAVLQS